MSDQTTFDDVTKYILNKASSQELNTLIDYYKARRKHLGVEIGLSFKPGDLVMFDAKSRGVIRGKFVKQMNKNAEVIADDGRRWKVSPQFLRKQ